VKSSAPGRLYRADIDGIRAIAILSVALYHAGVPMVSGGFTGVDIFFVISGYLIGGHIFSEVRTNSFSYLRFYQRRAKRILPAFYAVLAFILLVSLVLGLPEEARETARSSFAATLSASNILFWASLSYFSPNSQLNPLLMTWSLGIEEQFYLVIPLLMVLLGRIRRSLMLPAILLVCSLSFLWACRQLIPHPGMVFYMLPSRAWELGVGVALAVAELSRRWKPLPAWMTQTLGTAGLVLMFAPIFLLRTSTPFPGAAALPSVLGAAMIIACPASWINRRILSLRPLVFMGRVSYSWYLWHWPLIAFTRVLLWGKLPVLYGVVAISAAFGAAVLCYYFVEQPFRKTSMAPRPLLFRYAMVSVAFLAVCAVIWRTDGLPRRYASMAHYESANAAGGLHADRCLVNDAQPGPNVSAACYPLSAGQPAVAILGDSHAAAVAPALRSMAAAQGLGFIELTRGSCLPLTGATSYSPSFPQDLERCRRFNQKAFDLINANKDIRIVVLAGYWATPFHRQPSPVWLVTDGQAGKQVPTLDATRSLYIQGLTASIQRLQSAGKQVIVIQDAPEFDFDPYLRVKTTLIPARRVLASWLGGQDANDPGVAPLSDQDNRRMSTDVINRAVAAVAGAEFVDITTAFCNSQNLCMYRDRDQLLYGDTMHISRYGSFFALRDFHYPALAEVSR
jgi:peptidoglycan/LPS O-acetylase OafA/YrhL